MYIVDKGKAQVGYGLDGGYRKSSTPSNKMHGLSLIKDSNNPNRLYYQFRNEFYTL